MNERTGRSVRQRVTWRGPFLVCALSLVFLVPWAGGASAAISQPADGSIEQSSPTGFSGDASLDFARFESSVFLQLSGQAQFVCGGCAPIDKVPSYGPLNPAGDASAALDPGGAWNVATAALGHRADVTDPAWTPAQPALPDGTPLADGRYTVEVTQTDHTVFPPDPGSPDHNRWSSTFFVDSAAPDTVIDTALPASPTNATDRSFTFHTDDPPPTSGTTTDCRLDGGPWQGCDSTTGPVEARGRVGSEEFSGLAEGSHSFEVRATDLAGNQDPTPAVSSWMVDTTDPVITLGRPAMRERFVLGQNVPAVYSCSDPLSGTRPVASGVKTCSGPAKVDTSKLGNFTYTVYAEDHAGNTHSVKHSYAVDPPHYASLVLPRNPIAYYRLGDPLGSTVMRDSSANHHDGEFKGDVSQVRRPAIACHLRPHRPYTCDLTDDPQDSSTHFPARDGYGFANGISAPKTGYSIEAWIRRDNSGDGSIAGHGGGGQLFVHDGRLALRQTQDTVFGGGPVLTPGKWWHVAATWNGSRTRLYVNGAQVASSSTANKPPSGSGTFYVGYGDQAPWFTGDLDEVAYYGTALSAGQIATRYVVGTAHDVPSPVGGPPIQRPSADIVTPPEDALYAPTKVPVADFGCSDLDGNHTVASCTATIDGSPIVSGGAMPDSPGPHSLTVVAVDDDGLTRSHTHGYAVKTFEQIYKADAPLAYYRLGDPAGDLMKDSGPAGRHGTYKNGQESGPVGISGDGDHARRFFGAGGYGLLSGIPAPKLSSTLEAWVNPDDSGNASIAGHGDAGELFIKDGRFGFRHMGQAVTADVGPAPGSFTQVAGVWDGVNLMIYVDGKLRGVTPESKRPGSSSTFYVGYGQIEPWFRGSIDEVAYYDRALSGDRILQHFLADPPPDDLTPVPPAASPPDGDPSPPPGPGPAPAPGVVPTGSTPADGGSGGKAGQGKRAKSKKKARTRVRKRARAKSKKRARARCKRKRSTPARRSCLRRV